MARKLDLIAVALIGGLFLFLMPWSRMLSASNDFVNLYIGGSMFGHSNIYSPAAIYARQRQLIGGTLEHSIFVRPLFYAFLLKPLSLLPYKTAYWIFQAGSLLSFCVFARLNARHLPHFGTICAMSPPLFANFMNGQDVCYLLLFCSTSLLCVERGWEILAGLVMSLCAIKAHLFVLVPVAALLWKRWRILAGGAIGGTILVLTGLAGGGLRVQLELFRQLENPEHSPYPALMPSVRSLAGDHHDLFYILSLAVFGIVIYLMHRSGSYQAAFGWALIGGLLTTFHAYMQDCLVLVLALRLLHTELAQPAKVVLYIAVLPFLYVALVAGSPYSGIFPATLLLFLGLQLYETLKIKAPAAAAVEA